MQEVRTRLPGRTWTDRVAFDSIEELAGAMKRAEHAHGEHERRTGRPDAEWPAWYAEYMRAEQAGTELPL
jgi:hypothetical protein